MTLLTTWAGAAALLDHIGASRRLDGDGWDAIVVAGCHVRPDGSPSPALAGRVRRAVELYHRGVAPRLVLTGGVGPSPPAEAVAAARLAERLGVPSEAMVIEDRSTSTEENAAFARSLLDARRIVVVSDSYHVLRCEMVFRRYFGEVRGVGSLSPPAPRAAGALREVVALSWYAVTGRLARRDRA